MKKRLTFFFVLIFPFFVFGQNVGIGTTMPLVKLHVVNEDNSVLLLENTQVLSAGVNTSMYFKTGNGDFPYTGGIKTIGTTTNTARLGLFTFAASSPNSLLERMSILNYGNVGISTVEPLKKLHIQIGGASLLTSAFGDGILFSTNNASGARIFLENLPGASGEKSMALVTENVSGAGGTTYFGSLSDDGGSWIEQGIISMNHSSGNVGIGQLTPSVKLDVNGALKVAGIISGVSNPLFEQDVANKAYVDLLQPDLTDLQGLKDIDNNKYRVITIGTQTWMAENLKTSRYNTGEIIPAITDVVEWQNASTNNTPAHCWYNNVSNNLVTYGALYNWYAIDTLSNGGKNVCPIDWHVPADAEWDTLINYLGGTTVAGGKMREAGMVHWQSPNSGATNASSFAGLPGGERKNDGVFDSSVSYGFWWSSTDPIPSKAYNQFLGFFANGVYGGLYDKGSGESVRCLRDD